MCNNYASQGKAAAIGAVFEELGLAVRGAEEGPSGETKPTDVATVVRPVATGVDGVEVVTRRWGFAPPRPKAGAVINLRSDDRSFDAGRCLIPATSFHEYTGTKYPKTKWRFTLRGDEWFCVAGIWKRGADGEERFAMLTTPPGPDVAPYHDRQIAVLRREDWARWLAREPVPPGWLQALPGGSLAVEQVAPSRRHAGSND